MESCLSFRRSHGEMPVPKTKVRRKNDKIKNITLHRDSAKSNFISWDRRWWIGESNVRFLQASDLATVYHSRFVVLIVRGSQSQLISTAIRAELFSYQNCSSASQKTQQNHHHITQPFLYGLLIFHDRHHHQEVPCIFLPREIMNTVTTKVVFLQCVQVQKYRNVKEKNHSSKSKIIYFSRKNGGNDK